MAALASKAIAVQRCHVLRSVSIPNSALIDGYKKKKRESEDVATDSNIFVNGYPR